MNNIKKRDQLTIDGRTIEYYHTGKKGKRALIFLPGLCADCSHWDKVIPYLVNSFNIYAFSLPLYGTTNSLHERYAFHTLSILLSKLIKHFHIRKPILVGHSIGSIVAILYSIDNPKKVMSVINISSPLRSNNHRIPGIWKAAVQIAFKFKKNTEILMWLETKKELLQALLHILPNQKSQKMTRTLNVFFNVPLKCLALCYHDLFYMSFDSIVEKFSQLPIPKLFIYGTRDDALDKLHVLDLYTKITGSEIIPFNEEHFIATSQPTQLAKTISRFCAKPNVVST